LDGESVKKYAVALTPRADRELEEAADWYASRDLEIAYRWYIGFRTEIMKIAEDPFRHGLLTEQRYHNRSEYRQLIYGSGQKKTHRAVYRILDDVVEVLTIAHLSRDELKDEDLY
jgi:plasmid stabilization system protein ParE